MSMILKHSVKLSEEPCDSTEDLLSWINVCNRNEDITNCVIGSFDVYPSLDIDFTEKSLEIMSEFQVEFNNLDLQKTCLYLCMNLDKDVLTREGLKTIVWQERLADANRENLSWNENEE